MRWASMMCDFKKLYLYYANRSVASLSPLIGTSIIRHCLILWDTDVFNTIEFCFFGGGFSALSPCQHGQGGGIDSEFGNLHRDSKDSHRTVMEKIRNSL